METCMLIEKNKHIDVKMYLIRDEIAKGSIVVTKIHIDVNLATMLAKMIPTAKFKFCVNLIGVSKVSGC